MLPQRLLLLAAALAGLARSQSDPLRLTLGGTLSWDEDPNSEISLVATEVNNGLQLLADIVQAEAPFHTSDGRAIVIDLLLYDDQNDADRAVRLYRDMYDVPQATTLLATTPTTNTTVTTVPVVDLLIGPSTPELSQAAASIATEARRPILLHADPRPSTYAYFGAGEQYVFSTNRPASRQLEDALRALYAQGARTIAIAYHNAEYEAACTGGAAYAQSIGYLAPLKTFFFNIVNLAGDLRATSLLGPDVFIGCGPPSQNIAVVATARAIGFSPRAIILSHAATDAFPRAVGTPNANYLLGPVDWHQDFPGGEDCSRRREGTCAFGAGGARFAETFNRTWGRPPGPAAARAVAAGLALLAAASQIDSADWQTQRESAYQRMQANLIDLNEPSFYGRLRFSSEGTLLAGAVGGITVQVQPLPAMSPRHLRYLRSDFALVSYGDDLTADNVTRNVRGTLTSTSGTTLSKTGTLTSTSETETSTSTPGTTSETSTNTNTATSGGSGGARRLSAGYQDRPGVGLLWPMPTWDQKELEVLPCDPGMFVNESNETTLYVACDGCPAGRHRSRGTLSCYDCGNSFYADEKGAATCKPCPEGADCSAVNSEGLPEARPGWFRLPYRGRDGPVFMRCHPARICLGANKCLGENKGVLCRSCDEGYSNRAFLFLGGSRDDCSPCADDARTWLALVFILGMVLFYGIVIGHLTLASSGSVRAIHSIILKKIVNHWQLISTGLMACEFSGFEIPAVKVLYGVTEDPFEAMVNFDCLARSRSSTTNDEVMINLSLILIPLVLLGQLIFFSIRYHLIWKRLQARISEHNGMVDDREYQEDKPTPSNGEDVGDKLALTSTVPTKQVGASSTDMRAGHGNGAATMLPSGEVAKEEPVNQNGTKPVTQRNCTKPVSPLVLSKMKNEVRHQVKNEICRWMVVWVFILHPMVIRMCLKGITCKEMDVLRLNRNYDMECRGEDHDPFFWRSVTGLTVYGFGIPIAFFYMLYRVRFKLLDDKVRKFLGFLYNGFEGDMYFFEVVHMLRKVLVLIAACIPIMSLRIFTMLGILFVFLVLHIFGQPYDNRDYFLLDRLEFSSLMGLIVLCTCRLFFLVRESVGGTDAGTSVVATILNHPVLELSILVTNAGWQAHFWLVAFWGLFRNSIVKHIYYKAEAALEHTGPLQRIVLALEPHTQQAKLDLKTAELSTSGLSNHEIKYLEAAVSDTIKYYMEVEPKFHVSRVLTVIREAVAQCSKQRVKRTNMWRDLLHRVENDVERRGACSCIRQLKEEYHHAQDMIHFGHHVEDHHMQRHKQHHHHHHRDHDPGSVRIEELYNALMVLWPDIARHVSAEFVMDKPKDPLWPWKPEITISDKEAAKAGPTVSDTFGKRIDDTDEPRREIDTEIQKVIPITSSHLARQVMALRQSVALKKAERDRLKSLLEEAQASIVPDWLKRLGQAQASFSMADLDRDTFGPDGQKVRDATKSGGFDPASDFKFKGTRKKASKIDWPSVLPGSAESTAKDQDLPNNLANDFKGTRRKAPMTDKPSVLPLTSRTDAGEVEPEPPPAFTRFQELYATSPDSVAELATQPAQTSGAIEAAAQSKEEDDLRQEVTSVLEARTQAEMVVPPTRQEAYWSAEQDAIVVADVGATVPAVLRQPWVPEEDPEAALEQEVVDLSEHLQQLGLDSQAVSIRLTAARLLALRDMNGAGSSGDLSLLVARASSELVVVAECLRAAGHQEEAQRVHDLCVNLASAISPRSSLEPRATEPSAFYV